MTESNALTYDIDAVKAVAQFLSKRRTNMNERQSVVENGLTVVAVNEHETIHEVSQKLEATGKDRALLAVYFPSHPEDSPIPEYSNVQLLMYEFVNTSPTDNNPEYFGGTSVYSEIGLFCMHLWHSETHAACIPRTRGHRSARQRIPVASLVRN